MARMRTTATTTNFNPFDVRMMDIRTACAYINLGTNKGREFLEGIGAKRKVGSRVLYDRKIIDAALDNMTDETAAG